MSALRRWFKPVLGRPCWGVHRGYGSFLLLEFRKPRLLVREPIVASKGTSRRVRSLLARRQAFVHGEWQLWIYCCNWAVYSGDRLVGDSSSSRGMERAARFLNGQKLMDVELARRGARTRFTFDLGGVLVTMPYDRGSEQWMLFGPGRVLTLRADRKYSYRVGRQATERWRGAA